MNQGVNAIKYHHFLLCEKCTLPKLCFLYNKTLRQCICERGWEKIPCTEQDAVTSFFSFFFLQSEKKISWQMLVILLNALRYLVINVVGELV